MLILHEYSKFRVMILDVKWKNPENYCHFHQNMVSLARPLKKGTSTADAQMHDCRTKGCTDHVLLLCGRTHDIRKDELMREAKFAATVFGAVSVCLVGGLAAAYMTAPEVGSASVSDTAEAIGEELIFAPIATSVSTTTIVTTYTSATTQCTTETTTTAPVFYEADSTAMEDDTSYDTSLWSYTTEAYTEPYTETYDYSFPAIDQTADEEIGIYSDVTVIETAPVETTTTAQMTTTAEPVTEPPTVISLFSATWSHTKQVQAG